MAQTKQIMSTTTGCPPSSVQYHKQADNADNINIVVITTLSSFSSKKEKSS